MAGPKPGPESPQTLDASLWRHLEGVSFQGPAYDLFEHMLIKYALPMLVAMTHSGKIIRLAAEINRPIRGPLPTTAEDIADVTTDAIVGGVEIFRRSVRERTGWRADGGASLNTYFLGACVRTYSSAHRAWLRRAAKDIPAVPLDDLVDLPADHAHDPSDDGSLDRAARELLPDLDRRNRAIWVRYAQGYTLAEIAKVAGTTPRGVEGVLYRIRGKLRTLPAR